jgi:23S rRNA (cytosine1962-C5)-methyltransferase
VVRLRLKPGRDKPARQGHPWLYSGAIAAQEGPADAPLARVEAADGAFLGLGFHSPGSQIRVRFLGRDASAAAADREFFAARLGAARRLRQAVVPAATSGYRLLNAEGDGVPGWTVDRFGDLLVSQVTVAGLEALRGEAYASLRALYPGLALLQANRLPARRLEGLPAESDEVVAGAPPAEVEFSECGLAFTAAVGGAQKTGFYCDQRDNRRLVEAAAGGRRVLDLFAHSGAFGVYARRGGATRLVQVESAPALLRRGLEHHRRNGFDPGAVEWVTADVFDDLRRRDGEFDLVVCDPPPLARRRVERERAARAYKDVNRLALRRLAAGGFLFTFSCSGAVDTTLFRQILFAAALEAGVELQLLRPLAAAPDHPVAATHPEGEYLKGWWAAVR